MPKDKKGFDGKNKTKDTYDGDWVFVKNKHTKGPNDSAGAWMTKKQAKKVKQDNKPSGPATPPVAATPGVPGTAPIIPVGTSPVVPAPGLPVPPGPNGPYGSPVPGQGPGDKGGPIPTLPTAPGGSGLGGHTSKRDAPGASYNSIPSWWVNKAYTNPNEMQTFANSANALIPYLSPEDQRNMANYLATNYKDVYGAYATANFGPIPTTMGEAERNSFLSNDRAKAALNILQQMKTASGSANMGAGFDFLTNAVGMIQQYNSGQMTREQYDQFSKAVSDFTATATSDQKAYANLAQLFNLPSFTAGPIVSNAPSNKLYS